MRRILVILLPLVICVAGFAQSPYFHHYSMGSNLSASEKINLLYGDPLGPIWIGTDDGLFLFDGQHFHTYHKMDTSSAVVSALIRDHNNLLWVGYEDGSIYHLENEKLNAWEPEEGTPASPIISFLEDGEGGLWFSTYGEGLYYWNGTRMYNIDEEDGLLGNEIYVMQQDAQGRMWCGTDAGISICSQKGAKKEIINLTADDGLPDEIVKALVIDGDKGCWIGMYDQGVCYFDFATSLFKTLNSDWIEGVVSNLELFVDKELWIGTEENGLLRWSFDENPHDGSMRSKPEKIGTNLNQIGTKIYDLHKDFEGNIWVASNSKFINRAQRQFEILQTDLPAIQSIIHGKNNVLWIGTEEGLFDMANKGKYNMWLNGQKINVLSLYEDRFGNIWAGSFGDGVFCIQPSSGRWLRLSEKEGLTNGSVLSIDGKDERLWLATLGGVTEFICTVDPFSGILPVAFNYNQENGLGTNFIYKVLVCTKGDIWFGTDGKGMSVLRNGVLINYDQIAIKNEDGFLDSIALRTIYSITEDANGNMWFSTADNGLFKFDGNDFQQYHLDEGIRDLGLTCITATEEGQIMLVHPLGIDLMDPNSGEILYFDESIGLENFDPNINVVSKDLYGNIWTAGQTEIIKFTHLKEELIKSPPIYLLQLPTGLTPYDQNAIHTFAYRDNNFLFKYLGLWYTDPERVNYRYRLLGYDSNWKKTGDRLISYSKLPWGNYQFQLMAAIGEVFSGEPTVKQEFYISPPFWATWWFWIAITTILLGAFIQWQKWREQRIEKLNQLEKEKVFSQLNALKSQISPHFLFNSFNTLVGIIEDNPKLAVEYVEQLSDFYRAILQYRNKDLISIAEELALLKNYGYLLKRRFGQNLQLDIQVEPNGGLIPPLSLQMLVENAIKHNVISKANPLIIKIYNHEQYIGVENNKQPKIKTDQSTHFGLESLRKRYNAFGKPPIEVSFDENRFIVNLPILKNPK